MSEKNVTPCPLCGEGHWTKLPDGLNLCVACRRDRVAFYGAAYLAWERLEGGTCVRPDKALAAYDAQWGIGQVQEAPGPV